MKDKSPLAPSPIVTLVGAAPNPAETSGVPPVKPGETIVAVAVPSAVGTKLYQTPRAPALSQPTGEPASSVAARVATEGSV